MKYGYEAYISQQLKEKLFSGHSIMIPSIADAQSGFWVNDRYEFTRGDDALFWIAPSSIVFVEKIAEEQYFVSKEVDETL